MPKLTQNLLLPRCPHCSIATPNLSQKYKLETTDQAGANRRSWGIYVCCRCGGVVTASAFQFSSEILECYPSSSSVDDDIPQKPRSYLQQALESLHAPAGAVMLTASAVDAMLKLKGYTEGSLYSRIEKAAQEHVITSDMAKWAHDVRLDANDQRHADEDAHLPSTNDAQRAIDFARALGEILYVLPNRVARGITNAQESE
ncbi:hypothetical protein CK501_14950 [Halovibrio salipaludis]|uniref:DUF4145 domain-containing protein n=1 Tax=Halovibrio salipaludis TaxID=2032626 RepID=A0A2A2EYX8_9GAMM|nr:DUF4145 domain-containing protein [Halovibrio salipaludis]PAU77750.1 hypothetical protein CK501_14950 [Halovibrio salipaludis]